MMQQFIDKLIGRLEYLQKDKYVLAPTVCYVLEGVKQYVNQLAEEHKGGWIPCSEQKPKDGQKVITCDDRGNLHVFCFDTERQCFVDDSYRSIRENHPQFYVPIAWMPLPEPYQKEGEQI